MPTLITTLSSLNQYDIIESGLPGIPYALIVSNTKSKLYEIENTVYVVPSFCMEFDPSVTDPSISNRGVLVKGHRGNYHELIFPENHNLFIATHLLRAVTKERFIGKRYISTLRKDLQQKVEAQLRDQLGF